MQKINISNPFFEFMGNLGDWLILNILFVLTCIPVVTFGVASTAMYQTAFKLLRGQNGYVVKTYFQACKKEWKKSTAVWLILFFVGGILCFDVMYAERIWKYFTILIGCLILLWSFITSYVFPFTAQFDNSVKNILKNALYLSVRHLPATLVIVIVNAIPVICMCLGEFAMAMAVPLYCTFGFALMARVNSILFLKIFTHYMDDEGELL